MSTESDTLEVLTRVVSEMEANLIVQCLTDCGIAATAVGGFTSGFKAEAPGDVSVLVKHRDLARAKSALIALREENSSDQATVAKEDGAARREEPYGDSDWRWAAKLFWAAYLLVAVLITFIGYSITRNLAFLLSAITIVLILGLALHLSRRAIRR